MGEALAAKYQLHALAAFHWAGWNDEYVVFDEASGQTHQLDAVRAFVLNQLVDSSKTSAELALDLSILPAFATSETVHEILQGIFSEFEANGMVEVI